MMQLDQTLKRKAANIASQVGQGRWGLVSSTRQTDTGYESRVLYQPENVLSGWLPVLSPFVGAGWGVVCPPSPGMQAFIVPHEGHGEHGVIMGLGYSLQAMPPVPQKDLARTTGAVQAGEFCVVSPAGAILRFLPDGTVLIKASTTMIDGNLTVQGSVVIQQDPSHAGGDLTLTGGNILVERANSHGGDITDMHGSLDRLRGNYDNHIHTDSHGDTTGLPNTQDPE